MNIHYIGHRLSLRKPQQQSLEILDEICSRIQLSKDTDVGTALSAIQERYPTVTSFEDRDFVSLCFALATGVGKTRLMGTFIAYLHLVHKVRHFFVLAPNLTIYEKLITDFTPNTKKYVLAGLESFALNPPEIITGDNYESGRGVREERRQQRGLGFGDQSTEDDPIHINIFNISKINSEMRGGRSPRVKRLHEYIGESYFEYLASLPDLVLLMDESHRYRGSAGIRAINELKPILGLELTATPWIERGGNRRERFQNIAYEYPLANALEDGFVKTPAVVTRENFRAENYNEITLEDLKLTDGIRVHEETKGQLAIYAKENGKSAVKPFMLVVAQNIDEAARLKNKLESESFLGGRYKDRVIQVHSNQTGEERDETVKQLLDVENPDNPTEIVVHVNMLKEGWDVTNLYTIVPLRAANSRLLVEQSVGRGLRLPYGRRTGVYAVDRLNIVSHDRFDEIVAAANDPNSIIRDKVVIGVDIPETAQKTVEVRPKLEEAVTNTAVFASPAEQRVAQTVLDVLPRLKQAVRTDGLTAESVRQELIEQVKLAVPTVDVDVAAVVEKTVEAVQRLTIGIPRIVVVPKGETNAGYRDFDLDTRRWPRYAPSSEKIVIQHLTDGERYRLNPTAGVLKERTFEDYIVTKLIDYEQISYDEHSDLLYKLARQAVAHVQSYLTDPEEVENVLQHHAAEIAKLVFAQMEEHYDEGDPEYEVTVKPGYQMIQPRLTTVDENTEVLDFRQEVKEKSEIRGLLFGGFKKCLTETCKFEVDTERVFAVILEEKDNGVVKWFRPGKQDIRIYYTWGGESPQYVPDFIVETRDGKWICETKRQSDMADPEVIAKANAGALWCEHATQATGEKWGYLLIPHDHVRLSMTFSGFLAGCRYESPARVPASSQR